MGNRDKINRILSKNLPFLNFQADKILTKGASSKIKSDKGW